MKRNNRESGQILIGGLFFLFLAGLSSVYFISISNIINELYSNTLKLRFEAINMAAKQANILNQISINNQLIISEVLSAHIAYITAIESGLNLTAHQPYWETYSHFKESDNLSALSQDSSKSIEKSFSSYALISGRGLYGAKAIANQNIELIKQLPKNVQRLISQSSNAFVHCLALEIQAPDLNPSQYFKFSVPTLTPIGLTKNSCSLYEKNNSFLTKITSSLPMLTANDDDLVISFEMIDKYFNFKENFSYGVIYVKPKFASKFISILKFNSFDKLGATIRISHPEFSCLNQRFADGDFILEQDWQKPCHISINQFFRAFLKPHWAALVTHQAMRKKYH